MSIYNHVQQIIINETEQKLHWISASLQLHMKDPWSLLYRKKVLMRLLTTKRLKHSLLDLGLWDALFMRQPHIQQTHGWQHGTNAWPWVGLQVTNQVCVYSSPSYSNRVRLFIRSIGASLPDLCASCTAAPSTFEQNRNHLPPDWCWPNVFLFCL